MTDITNIPLDKLIAWEGNARRTMSEEGLNELASSIKAHGLLQSIVVKKDGMKYAVVAGNRRLAALQRLAKAKDIDVDHPVPCQVTEDDKAAEVNLAENTVRESMHPADQFEAFRKLIDDGKSAADVAAAFGVTETVVLQRMKLAQVSPVIIQAYREEELNLEQVIAFAVTDDQQAQERVFEQVGNASHAYIRRMLTENEIAVNDDRVRFVGLRAYEKAGGNVKRDLFSDDEKGGFITDTDLLAKLAQDKLEKTAAKIRKENWKWVEISQEFSYQDKAKFQQLRAEAAPLSADLESEAGKLRGEYDKLVDSDNEESSKRLDEIDARLNEIEECRGDEVFTREQLAIAGSVVTIGDDGKAGVTRGLVRPEDMPQKKGKSKAKASDDANAEQEPEQASLSASLIEELTAHRSAAIAATLKDAPSTALAAVVYTLVLDTFDHYTMRDEGALKISGSSQSLHRVEGSEAFRQMEEARAKWQKRVPAKDKLWPWLLMQDNDTLLEILAFCAAASVNAVQQKNERADSDRLVHVGLLARDIKLDMKEWFVPTADNYFSRVGKQQILEALQEVEATMPSNSMKKAELAKYAEQSVAGKGWLPKPLRAA